MTRCLTNSPFSFSISRGKSMCKGRLFLSKDAKLCCLNPQEFWIERISSLDCEILSSLRYSRFSISLHFSHAFAWLSKTFRRDGDTSPTCLATFASLIRPALTICLNFRATCFVSSIAARSNGLLAAKSGLFCRLWLIGGCLIRRFRRQTESLLTLPLDKFFRALRTKLELFACFGGSGWLLAFSSFETELLVRLRHEERVRGRFLIASVSFFKRRSFRSELSLELSLAIS